MKTVKAKDPINFKRLLQIVMGLSNGQKEILYKNLQKEKAKSLLRKVKRATKDFSITEKEILEEVEIVRAKNYSKSLKK